MLCCGFALAGFLFYRHVNRRKRALQQDTICRTSSKAALTSTPLPPPPQGSQISLETLNHQLPPHLCQGVAAAPIEPVPSYTAHQKSYPNYDRGVSPVLIKGKIDDSHSSSSSFAHFESVQSSSSVSMTTAPHLPSLHLTPPDGDIGGHILGIDGRPIPSESHPAPNAIELGRVSDSPPMSGTSTTAHHIAPSERTDLPQYQRVPYDQWRFGL